MCQRGGGCALAAMAYGRNYSTVRQAVERLKDENMINAKNLREITLTGPRWCTSDTDLLARLRKVAEDIGETDLACAVDQLAHRLSELRKYETETGKNAT